MSRDDRVTHQLALVKDEAISWTLARIGGGRPFAIPKREASLRHLPGRFEEGAQGLKWAVVEVEMPRWIARDRGLE